MFLSLPDHLFVADNGDLFDTRAANWSANPLRRAYQYTFGAIDTLAELKACLRNGEYAWPGGYPLYFITGDGEAMSFDTVRKNFRLVADAMNDCAKHGTPRHWSGWAIAACAINHEDSHLYCCHSGDKIQSAYEQDDEEFGEDSHAY